MSSATDVLIVGAGHAGLATAYHITRRRRDVVVVDRAARVGDGWRERYDSLRLFSPAVVSALPGLPMGPDVDPFPTKDQVADYHERYAAWLGAPIRLRTEVTAARIDGGVTVTTTAGEIAARELVVATGRFRRPLIPSFASGLAMSVTQMHASAYRRPADIPRGTAMVVGSGNSGGDIAAELARDRAVLLSEGKPRRPPPPWWRSAWAWRIARLRDRWTRGGSLPGPLVWPLKRGEMFLVAEIPRLVKEGRVRILPRAVGAAGDEVLLEDGARVRVDAVVWATGYQFDLSWVSAPQDPRVHALDGRFLFGLSRQAEEIGRKSERFRPIRGA